MTAVERIKDLCKKKGIAISKLERDCGFSNGYIGSLKKGTMPYDRLEKVAEYLDTTPDFLSRGYVNYEVFYDDDTFELTTSIKNREALRLLMYAAMMASDEDLDFAREYLERMKKRVG